MSPSSIHCMRPTVQQRQCDTQLRWKLCVALTMMMSPPNLAFTTECRVASWRKPHILQFATEGKESFLDGGGDTTRRRRKKNKYGKFSKTDQLTVDPFEAMIKDSIEKSQKPESETNSKKRDTVSLLSLLDEKDETRERNKRHYPDTRAIDPYDPTTYGYTELGSVIGAHGVHGFVKVAATTDFPERLCNPGIRHLKATNRRCPREIFLKEGKPIINDQYLVKFEGIHDRDAATKLRGSVLYARHDERPSSVGVDEFLVTELVGCDVFLVSVCDDSRSEESMGDKFVGTVGGIILANEMCSTPGLGQNFLEVVLLRNRQGTTTPSWRDEMVLIPLVPQIVPTVDVQARKIYINPPGGLLDLTYVKEEKVRLKGFLPPAKDDSKVG